MSFMGGKNLRRNYGKTRAAVASVATERFQILLDQAKKMAWTDERLSRRYVTLARKISSRTKVRIPRESKMYLCKGCGLALVRICQDRRPQGATTAGPRLVVRALRISFAKDLRSWSSWSLPSPSPAWG